MVFRLDDARRIQGSVAAGTILLSLLLTACGGNDPEKGAEGAGGAADLGGDEEPTTTKREPTSMAAEACVKVPEFLEAERSCIRDGDCACGAHCEFQECTYSCVEDEDCEGELVCSSTGRCEEEGASRLKHRVSNASGLEASSDLVQLSSGQTEVLISRRFGASDDLRVVASDGVEVSCGGDFSEECFLEDVGLEPVALVLRGKGSATSRTSQVRILPRVGVPLRIDAQLAEELFDNTGWETLNLGATYRGVARMSELGLGARGAVPSALREAPIEVELYPGAQGVSRLFRLKDPTGAFTDQTRELAGTLELLANDTFVALRPYLYTGDEIAGPHSLQLTAVPTAEVDWWTDQSVHLTLNLGLSGISATEKPTLSFELELTRAGGAPVAAPPTLGAGFNGSQSQDHAVSADPLETAPYQGQAGFAAALNASCRTDGNASSSLSALPSGGLSDLRCDTGERGFFYNYVASAEDALGGGGDTLSEVLEDCRLDLAPLSGGDAGDGSCIEIPRAMTALGLLAEQNLGSASWATESSYKRAVQRWLELYLFVSNHAIHQETLSNAVLRRSNRVATLGQWMQLLDPMLDKLLVPRLGTALTRLSPAALVTDEYETSSLAKASAGDRTIALTLLRALSARLELQDLALVEEMQLNAGVRNVPDSVGDVLRRTTALAAVAGGWSAVAIEEDAAWASDSELVAAWTHFERSYGRLLGRVNDYRLGRDEFGLSPNQVPIYLSTSQTTAQQRAFAVSDFLQGSTDWLGAAIDELDDRFTAAVSLREQERSRIHENALVASQARLSTSALIRAIDEPLQALCPHDAPASTGTEQERADEAVAIWQDLDPRDCMIARGVGSCDSIPEPSTEWRATISVSDVSRHLCIAARLRREPKVGSTFGFVGSAISDRVALNKTLDDAMTETSWNLGVAEGAAGEFVLSLDGGDNSHPVQDLMRARASIESRPGDPKDYSVPNLAEESTRESAKKNEDAATAAVAEIQTQQKVEQFCDEQLGLSTRSGVVDTEVPAADDPSCYQGAAGQALFATRVAMLKISEARARLEEHMEAYQVGMEKCMLVQRRDAKLVTEESQFLDDTEELRTWSSVLGAVGGVLSSGGAMATARMDRSFFQIEATEKQSELLGQQDRKRGLATGAALGGAAMSLVSGVLDAAIAEKEAEYEMRVDDIERNFEQDECERQAKRELVGMTSANAALRTAALQWSGEMLKFANLKQEVDRLRLSALTTVQDARSLSPKPLSPSPWLSVDAGKYSESLRFARRVAHLAVLAGEYEQQESLGALRALVASAMNPEDLKEVQLELAKRSASGRIHGSAPETTVTVVSLRDEILATPDYGLLHDGEQNLGYGETFTELLLDQRFAVFDGDEYQGQMIPFELLAPNEQLEGLGANGFSEDNCAERVWSVAVGVISKDGQTANPGTTQTEVHLLKRNSFHSSQCADEGFQYSTFDPSKNLFLDSQVAEVPSGFTEEEPDPYTRLVLNNTATETSLAELERSGYDQGVQTGFAARGLFGQYALFIPIEQYEQCDAKDVCIPLSEGGLDLPAVDDVLLRFEYTAAVK